MEKLQQLLDDGIIDEVYNQLKTGKEAEVWLVSHRGEAVAAKLYKEREFRNFKNDAGYREGRTVRNSRTARAIAKGSKFGREASEEAWKTAEADAMETLHRLGVHVPKPVMFYDGVLLMEVIGDAEGRVAPRLVEAAISREQAGAFYERLRGDVVKMLAADLIHGDLSEFNILLGANGPVIIDFPQIVTAAKNSQSEQYFRRDLGNLLRFFAGIDASLNEKHAGDADDIWRAYVRRHLSPHYVPGGRQHHGGAKHHGGPRNDGARRDGNAPQQRREFSPSNDAGRRGANASQPRREFTPNNGAQNGPRREFTPNNGAPNGPRREFTPNNGAPNGPRREFTPNNGTPNGPRREFTPSSGGPRRDGGAQRERGPRTEQRKGPEVSFKGPSAPASKPSFNAPDNRGGGHRRRPKRHF